MQKKYEICCITHEKIWSISKKQLSLHHNNKIEITQTNICKDKDYCNFLTQTFLKVK